MPSIKKSKSHRSRKAIRSRKSKASRSRKTKASRSRKTLGGHPGVGLYGMNTVYDGTKHLSVPEYIALYKKSIKEVLAGNTSSKNYSNATWTYSPEQIATDLDIKVNVKRIEYDLWDLSKTELKGMLQDGHADLLHLQSALQAGADKTTLKKLLKDIVYLDQVMRAYASKD